MIKTATGAQRYNDCLHRIFDDAERRRNGLDVDYTAVIFRKFKIGCEVIALFPEIPGDMNPDTCSSYMRLGQHGAASVRIIDDTQPVRPGEEAKLRAELEAKPYGYRLKIVKRMTQQHARKRRQALEAMR